MKSVNGRLSTEDLRDSSVAITTLAPVELDLTGSLVEILDRTMVLRVTREADAAALVRGTLVRVQANDTLWLGEVAECQPEDDGSFQVRVALAHVLYGLAEIAHLAERFVANPGRPPNRESDTEPVFDNRTAKLNG